MIDIIKLLGEGAQITFIICATIVILAILAFIACFIFCKCKCSQKECIDNQKPSGKETTDDSGKGEKPAKSQEDCSNKLRHEEEDRAKALIKDLYEATRVKITHPTNQKEEKCDIGVAKELIKEYKSLLNTKIKEN